MKLEFRSDDLVFSKPANPCSFDYVQGFPTVCFAQPLKFPDPHRPSNFYRVHDWLPHGAQVDNPHSVSSVPRSCQEYEVLQGGVGILGFSLYKRISKKPASTILDTECGKINRSVVAPFISHEGIGSSFRQHSKIL